MTPKQSYQALIHEDVWQANTEQLAIVNYLNQQSLILSKKKWPFKKNKIYGTYLWGGVGVGKSAIAQIFFDNTPVAKKYWLNHNFLQYIINTLESLKNKTNPLMIIAQQLSKKYKLIYIDEFEINDISTVMLIKPILTYLIKKNTYLLFTSNTQVNNLYQNGLQRNHLLPTLKIMQQQLTEIELHGKDYRPEKPSSGHYIITKKSDLAPHFNAQNKILNNHQKTNSPLVLANKPLQVIYRDNHIVWVTLQELCGIPRCTEDYQLMATQIQVLLIADLEQFKLNNNNLITNFINLIDIVYCNNIKLIIAANTPIKNLCPKQHLLSSRFNRTASRLTELCQIITTDLE